MEFSIRFPRNIPEVEHPLHFWYDWLVTDVQSEHEATSGLRRDAERNRSQIVTAAEEALAMGDAWEAFSTYLFSLCALQAEDCGVRDVFRMTFPTAKGLEETR